LKASKEKTTYLAAMAEIEEKTKVNGKTCIDFKPRGGEHAYIRFANDQPGYDNKEYIHITTDYLF